MMKWPENLLWAVPAWMLFCAVLGIVAGILSGCVPYAGYVRYIDFPFQHSRFTRALPSGMQDDV